LFLFVSCFCFLLVSSVSDSLLLFLQTTNSAKEAIECHSQSVALFKDPQPQEVSRVHLRIVVAGNPPPPPKSLKCGMGLSDDKCAARLSKAYFPINDLQAGLSVVT
jgi:hypothetical protein